MRFGDDRNIKGLIQRIQHRKQILSKTNLFSDTFVDFDTGDSKFSPIKYEQHSLGIRANPFETKRGRSFDMGATFHRVVVQDRNDKSEFLKLKID